MPNPVDLKLYNKVKDNVYKRIPKHSAYRSGIVVQEYKTKFSKKYGRNKTPYKGKKTRKKGISRWVDERWTNQRGEIGYKHKNDVYRPSVRITKNTPTTFRELNKKQIKRARTEKYRKGRVARFKKGGGIGKSKCKMPTPPTKSTRKIKKVKFNENPVSIKWSQSPRSEEDFYYASRKNKEGRKLKTRKEINQNKRARQSVRVNYENRRREEDMMDMFLGKIPLYPINKKGGKWSLKYKKSINCKNPRGFSQKQHCKYGRKNGGAKTQKRKTSGTIVFKDYPDFSPNLTPREIFKLGSFGGTYWRPIKSKFFKNTLRNVHKNYPDSWWKGIPTEDLVSPDYDIKKNKYGTKVGTSLDFWESKNWIMKSHPYGWVHWYCDFYNGKRSDDDRRQITRWKQLTGPNGRFKKFLVTQILKKGGKWNDITSSPKIRQVLQHWGYKLTKVDFDKELKLRHS